MTVALMDAMYYVGILGICMAMALSRRFLEEVFGEPTLCRPFEGDLKG